jgi:hypothetical protein
VDVSLLDYFVTIGSPAMTYAFAFAGPPWRAGWRRELALALAAFMAGCDGVLGVALWNASKVHMIVYAIAAAIWCRVYVLIRARRER